jgi:prepilin-type N-terminal cleavage/methylation domain-containing protein
MGSSFKKQSSSVRLVQQKGFTLIEILVVIGIIAILAAIVIIAINPARQFAQARESERVSNVDSILDAIGQRMADNKGVFAGTGVCPAITVGSVQPIDDAAGGTGLDLATNCLVPTYIPALPSDPSNPTAPSTGYTVSVDSNGRTTVCAPDAVEPAIAGSIAICVTR